MIDSVPAVVVQQAEPKPADNSKEGIKHTDSQPSNYPIVTTLNVAAHTGRGHLSLIRYNTLRVLPLPTLLPSTSNAVHTRLERTA